MSEAGLVELLMSYYEIALTAIGVFVPVTSGYLIVAYLAGAKLDKTQVVIISVLYIGRSPALRYMPSMDSCGAHAAIFNR